MHMSLSCLKGVKIYHMYAWISFSGYRRDDDSFYGIIVELRSGLNVFP